MALALASSLAAELLLAGPVAASGLEVSVGDRLGDTTTLVSGRTVELVGSVFLDYSDAGCQPKDLTRITATVRLPAGVDLQGGAQATQAVAAPSASASPATLNFRWPVRVGAPRNYSGQLLVTAQSRSGVRCSATQNFRLVAVSRLALRVAGAVLYPDHIMIALAASMASRRPPSGNAYTDALNQQHDPRGQDFGRGLLDLVSLRRGRQQLSILGGSEFSGGRTGVACLDFARPRGFRHGEISYQLRFNWNGEKGFAPISGHGRLRVSTRAVNRAERNCLSQEGLATGQNPAGGR